MDPLTPPLPFTERHQFRARFVRPGGYTDPVQVALDYSLVSPSDITGVVLGGPEAQRAIWEATSAPNRSFVSEPPEPPEPGTPGIQRKIHSDQAVFTTLTGINTATEGLVRRAASMRCFDLTIEETWTEGHELARAAVFYLYGPSSIWNLRPTVDSFLRGPTEYTNTDLGIAIGPLRVSVDEEVRRKTDPDDEHLLLQRSVYALSILTDATPDELSDEVFLADARQLADDLLILASLASKTWIDWFRYTMYSGRRTVHHVRSTAREPESGFRSYDRMIVEPPMLREFLQTALPRYREARDDLHLPILTHVGTKDVRYADAQFLSQFSALEALSALNARRDGADRILGKADARRVRHAFRDALATLDLTPEAVDAIERKVPELNRHSFATVLDRLLRDLELDLADLYPEGARQTLVDTRNKLVHGDGALADTDEFFREATRLSGLLDRVLLRTLGWTDLSSAPSKHDLDWTRRPTP